MVNDFLASDNGIAKKRLFVDMDGTLAEFKTVDTLEKLYEQNYFLSLKPQMNVINAVKDIIRNQPGVEVYILSAVLSDSKYALFEKNLWLDTYLPEIDSSHRIFPPCGMEKREFIGSVLGAVNNNDFLLDDYSANLHTWEPPAIGIKLMNGINGNNGTWKNEKVSFDQEPDVLAGQILSIIENSSSRNESQYSFHRKGGR